MARGKKKEELSLDEKLEQALVSVEEQPYEVPENWCWTRIKEICEFERGITFPASAKENEETENNIACLRTANIQDELEIYDLIYVNKCFMKNNDLKLVRKDDIIMSSANSRELVGKTSYVHDMANSMTFGGFLLNIRAKRVLSKYLFYMLRFEFLAGRFRGESTQTTNIANINTTTLGNYCFPLPPLQEQQRIVDHIESLFAKLDEAKEKAKDVIDTINNNIEAVLHKAFTGQLTNEWRNSNVNIEKWNDTTLSDIVSGLKYGSSEKSDYEYKGTPVLRIPNIGDGIVDFSDLKYMSGELENPSHEVFENDILIIRSNGSRDLVGKCAIVPELKQRYAYASFLIRMKASEKVLPEYLVRFMNSSMARVQMFAKAKSSSGIHNINSKELGAVKICVPSIEEQKQILIIIREFVDKEKKAREIADEVIGNIDNLKKSILSKAFRGELGTNNQKEENSIELLKKILAEA